jgi:hypothetical protein
MVRRADAVAPLWCSQVAHKNKKFFGSFFKKEPLP